MGRLFDASPYISGTTANNAYIAGSNLNASTTYDATIIHYDETSCSDIYGADDFYVQCIWNYGNIVFVGDASGAVLYYDGQ